MGGKTSRDKGARGERELTALLPGAKKVSRMYQPGEDVQWLGYRIEAKRRENAFRFDYKHLRDVQILAKRADREAWLFTMTFETLIDLAYEIVDAGIE